MRILFLDIDGCLNVSPYGDDIYKLSDENIKKHYDDLTYLKDHIPICKSNLDALKTIVDATADLGIVWTTDWRFDKDDKYTLYELVWRNPKNWLETLPWLKNRIIGMTPKKMSSNRFEEIYFWLVANVHGRKYANTDWLMNEKQSQHSLFFKSPYYDIDNYAIVDDFDSPGMRHYGKHFFKCEYDKGLTMEIANAIIEYIHTNDFNENEMNWTREKCKF